MQCSFPIHLYNAGDAGGGMCKRTYKAAIRFKNLYALLDNENIWETDA